MELPDDNSKALVVLGTKDAPVNKRKRILDEDTHISNLEKIIVRDFFPDLPKLQAQSEYLDAVARKDTQKIWQLHKQYSIKRSTNSTPSVCTATPSTFETPESRIAVTPGGRPDTEKVSEVAEDDAPTQNPAPPETIKKTSTDVSLDKYLSQNVSEDTVSFTEIMEESDKKHRLKHAWLFEKEDEQEQESREILALPSAEDQCNAPRTNKVQTWKYLAKNALMYVPEGMELSPAEKIANVGASREIVHSNTRFTANPFNLEKHKETISEAATVKAMRLHGKIGPDGKEILPVESPKVGGYGFVATPSINPGVDASPLMTWGEIDGTPFRLDGSDTPVINRTPGPSFKIPEVPLRDRCLHELAEKASRAHRAKKEEALRHVRSAFASPSPKFSQSKTDRLLSLSPAAQRLVNKKLKINARSDKALRSTYTPSPGRQSVADGTPIINSSPASESGTPKSTRVPRAPKTPTSITDNLLQLPKRVKAQEFF